MKHVWNYERLVVAEVAVVNRTAPFEVARANYKSFGVKQVPNSKLHPFCSCKSCRQACSLLVIYHQAEHREMTTYL